MTRDEAVKILSKIWGGEPQHGLANKYADAFVALGILKLDEPKEISQIERVRRFMRDFHLGAYSPGQLESALKACGLKIVEAKP